MKWRWPSSPFLLINYARKSENKRATNLHASAGSMDERAGRKRRDEIGLGALEEYAKSFKSSC